MYRDGIPAQRQSHSAVSCAKMAEEIEMPFGMWTRVGPVKHVLHTGAHWRHLANTAEPSMFGWAE